MKKKVLLLIVSAVILLCLLSGCANSPGNATTGNDTPEGNTAGNVTAAAESNTSGGEAATTGETTTIMEETTGKTEINTNENGLLGLWYDVNGDSTLEIFDDELTITFRGNYAETFPYKITNTPIRYIVNSEENGYFGMLSDIEIREDGSLSAYEMVMDAEGHTYRFVRKEELEKEREIEDISNDAPKEIASEDIEEFFLVFKLSYPGEYGISDEWPVGQYSWSIEKDGTGIYNMRFSISGDSYMILNYSGEVSAEYVKGLAGLLKDEKIIEFNGYYKRNNVQRSGWFLYADYESGENLSVQAEGDAAATCVFEIEPLLDYANKQELELLW